MVKSILSAFNSARTSLTALLDGPKPDLTMDFNTPRVRDLRLRELKVFKEKLSSIGGRFVEQYDKLTAEDWDDDEDQQRAQDAITACAPLIDRLDGTKSEINVAIEEINELKEEEERKRVRDEERQERQQQQEAQAAALARAQPQAQAVDQVGPAAAAGAAAAGHYHYPPGLLGLKHMDVPKFDGSLLQWSEFWDSFEAAYHNNRHYQPIQKLNALRSLLVGDAKLAIAGMRVANDSYDRAVEVLKNRFGRKQSVIDAHYSALSSLPASTNQFLKLRSTVDQIEQHVNSLAALGEDIDTNQVAVSLIRSKLPSEVIYILEQARTEPNWTLRALRDALNKHLQNREIAEAYGTRPKPSFDRGTASHWEDHSSNSATAGTLFAGSRASGNNATKDYKGTCAFCLGEDHSSEKCKKYATLEARKEKIKGRCFNCLREGHSIGACFSDSACRICKKKRSHHTSLCFKLFDKPRPIEAANVASAAPASSSSNRDGGFLAIGETSILQTAQINVQSPHSNTSSTVRALFDPGSTRTYISADLAQRLALKPVGKESLSIYTFSSVESKDIVTPVVRILLRQQDDTTVEIVAGVVPNVTGNLRRATIDSGIFNQAQFKGLKLADTLPTVGEDMNLELLIGTDYYLDFMEPGKKLLLSPGLYLLPTTFGWVLGGRQSQSYSRSDQRKQTVGTFFVASTTMTMASLDSFSPVDSCDTDQLNLARMWEVETLGIKDHRVKDIGDEEALDRFKKSIKFCDGRYEAG